VERSWIITLFDYADDAGEAGGWEGQVAGYADAWV
jgi:hypothetical protein